MASVYSFHHRFSDCAKAPVHKRSKVSLLFMTASSGLPLDEPGQLMRATYDKPAFTRNYLYALITFVRCDVITLTTHGEG